MHISDLTTKWLHSHQCFYNCQSQVWWLHLLLQGTFCHLFSIILFYLIKVLKNEKKIKAFVMSPPTCQGQKGFQLHQKRQNCINFSPSLSHCALDIISVVCQIIVLEKENERYQFYLKSALGNWIKMINLMGQFFCQYNSEH